MTGGPYERFSRSELILRDELAIDRTAMANERTLLSYVRTALALVAAGAASIKLVAGLAAELLGWALIGLAVVIAGLGVWRFRRVARHIAAIHRASGDQPR